jgi:hypothetical protein
VIELDEALVTDHDEGKFGEAVAVFNEARTHRYLLTRRWSHTGGLITFLMLNPSTADAFIVDPTVRRCIGFAQREGAGGLCVVNAFALRSTDPKALYSHPDPIGASNDWHIRQAAEGSAVTVAAWGVHGVLQGRGAAVQQLLTDSRVPLHALGVTKHGHPKHPLYLAASSPLQPYGRPE